MSKSSQIPPFATIRAALAAAWSLETAVQWTPQTPAGGQCNVTTVVVHDLFGGDVLCTRLPTVDHFYNRLDGVVVDFTDGQFIDPIVYDDIPATRAEAMACVKPAEYQVLRERLVAALERRMPTVRYACSIGTSPDG